MLAGSMVEIRMTGESGSVADAASLASSAAASSVAYWTPERPSTK